MLDRGHSRTIQVVALTALFFAEGCATHLQSPPVVTPTPPVTAPPEAAPQAERPSRTFVATAYCLGTVTAAGTRVSEGTVAADPAVLPLGTVIRVVGLGYPFGDTFRVLDTGPKVLGRHIDVYVPDCDRARVFGRRAVAVSIVGRN